MRDRIFLKVFFFIFIRVVHRRIYSLHINRLGLRMLRLIVSSTNAFHLPMLAKNSATCIFRRRILTSTRTQPKVLAMPDITGNPVSTDGSNVDLMASLDEAIMNMITLEADPIPQLSACIKIDANCGFANCLLVFELLRNPPVILQEKAINPENIINKSQPRHSISAILKNLEQNFDNLTKREQYFAAAALAWSQGQYSRSSSLLESAILLSPGDTIALRLVQDMYMMSGDTRNALACVTRCLQTLDDGHFLHAHLMGMLSAGYLENGLLVDAEESSTRAVARTKGRDIWALHTLLNTLQLSGRSSEVLATLEEHEGKHEGTGLLYLSYNKGCALIQRGNYRGALRVYDDMIELMTRENSDRGNNLRSSAALAHATLLLWQICLSATTDSEAHTRWNRPELLALWTGVDLAQYPTALMLDLCKALALAGAASSKGLQTSMEDVEKPQKPMNLLGWLTSNVGAHIKGGSNSEKIVAPETKISKAATSSSASDIATAPASTSNAHAAKMLEKHITGLTSSQAGPGPDFPKLRGVQSTFTLQTCIPELRAHISRSSGGSEKLWQLRTCGESTIRAMTAFASADFSYAMTELNDMRPVMSRIGGSAVQRDAIHYTLIESCLRSDRLTEARLLLCERTVLAPNESQSWRRLASVFGQMGMPQLAKSANYTAWQLGIGQGGFGGAR